MGREETLQILREHRAELRERFGVCSVRLFGSTARDEAGPESDIDIVVDYETAPTLIGFLSLRSFLEDVLGARVDLVTESGLKDRTRPFVEHDAIPVT